MPFLVKIHLRRSSEKSSRTMAKTKKMPYHKVTACTDDGVRPSTSTETQGAKKLEKKGEHSQWISFLNDVNMQYTNEN